MQRYLFAVAGSLFCATAAAAKPDLCQLKEIEALNYKDCDVAPLVYFVGKEIKHGQLITLYLGDEVTGPSFDRVIRRKMQYFLQTQEDKSVDLKDFPQRASDDSRAYGSTVCLTKLLKGLAKDDFSTASLYSFTHYPYDRIAKVRYQLEGEDLITHYDGAYPFEGSAESTDGRVCTGDLRLRKEFVHWKQAAEACEKAFNAEVKPDEPQYMKPAEVRMDIDNAGRYYICEKTWQKPGKGWKEWLYRIDMDPKNSKPIFLKMETP